MYMYVYNMPYCNHLSQLIISTHYLGKKHYCHFTNMTQIYTCITHTLTFINTIEAIC